MKKKRCLKNFLICLLISALVLQPAIFSSSMQFISIAAEAAESEKQRQGEKGGRRAKKEGRRREKEGRRAEKKGRRREKEGRREKQRS